MNSQVLDVTKASYCTGSVSSALASGDARRGGPDTGPDGQVKRGVHSSTNQYLRGVSRSRWRRADPQRVNEHVQKKPKSTPNRRDKHVQKKTQEHCQLQAQRQDENQTKLKINVDMKITSSANNTSIKNLATMKDIRSHLDKILATGFDVMCGSSVQEGKFVFRKEVDEDFRKQRRSHRERDRRSEENSEHKISESRPFWVC